MIRNHPTQSLSLAVVCLSSVHFTGFFAKQKPEWVSAEAGIRSQPLLACLLYSCCSLNFCPRHKDCTQRPQRFDVPAGNCWLINLRSSPACCSSTTHQWLMNIICPSAASEESRSSHGGRHMENVASPAVTKYSQSGFSVQRANSCLSTKRWAVKWAKTLKCRLIDVDTEYT